MRFFGAALGCALLVGCTSTERLMVQWMDDEGALRSCGIVESSDVQTDPAQIQALVNLALQSAGVIVGSAAGAVMMQAPRALEPPPDACTGKTECVWIDSHGQCRALIAR